MQEQEFELQVGDTLQIGEYTVTVVDLNGEGEEVSVRIDPSDHLDELRFEDGVVVMNR